MITKTDCMSILIQLETLKGININEQLRLLAMSKEPPIEVLKFIANHQGIEVVGFYELIRKNHNKNKSKLYTNILNENLDADEILTTLSSLLTQILLYGRKVEQQEIFFREVRAEEISRVLDEYFKTMNITNCTSLLKLIRTDLCVLEYINGKRALN